MYDSNRRKEKNQLKQTIEDIYIKKVYYLFLILDSVFVIIIPDR